VNFLFRIEYYKEDERYPVIDFINTLSTKDKAKILREIDMLEEFGFALGMPYIKKMEGTDELWELRVKIGSNNYRIFYFHYLKGLFVLLHGIHKKSTKTLKRDINLAISRIQEYKMRKEEKNES
jgi:phage-related protein